MRKPGSFIKDKGKLKANSDDEAMSDRKTHKTDAADVAAKRSAQAEEVK